MRKFIFVTSLLISSVLTLALSSVSLAQTPVCYDKKKTLDFNEEELLILRESKPHKFKARALVQGSIVRLVENRQGHLKIEIDFDGNIANDDDRMVIVYNTSFGDVADFVAGDHLIACGDFVVDPYSPTKAVIHWLHYSPRKGAHDDGFLIINGVVSGLVSN